MTTATVQIATSTREQLRELAEQTGKSIEALIGEAVAAYRRRLSGRGKRIPAESAVSPPLDRSDELSSDPNVLAYEQLGPAFREENQGKYAAFRGGDLVAVSEDKAALLARIRAESAAQSCLVTRVTQEERIVRFRRPRRMFKTGL